MIKNCFFIVSVRLVFGDGKFYITIVVHMYQCGLFLEFIYSFTIIRTKYVDRICTPAWSGSVVFCDVLSPQLQ